MVVVDDADNARALGAAARAAGRDLGVFIDADIGQQRTGVLDAESALALAGIISAEPRLIFKGLQGYDGQVQHIMDFAERRRASPQSRAALDALPDQLGKTSCRERWGASRAMLGAG